ncbi:MAG: putative ABC transport system permease protein [Planctomycetota bacterium]|jgi:putative ABC transport system permease protein
MRLVSTIARRSLLKRPGRTFFAVSGIAMGIAVVVAIFTLDHNTIIGLSKPGDPEWRADVRVTPSASQKNPRADLEGIPGIDGITAFFKNDVVIAEPSAPTDAKDGKNRALLFALEAATSEMFQFYRVAEGTDLKAKDRKSGALIGQALAKELKLELGDPLTLARPLRSAKRLCVNGKMTEVAIDKPLPKKEREFTVRGILAAEKLGRQAAGRVVILDYTAADELFSDVGTQRDFLLKKSKDIDPERFKASLSKTFSFELNQEVVIGQAADERAFRNGVRFAGLMSLGLGLYVIFHVLSIALVERNREIATLTALGASKSQIAKIFFVEASILALVGAGAGLGLGILICRILLKLKITTLGAGRYIYGFDIPWAQIIPLAALGAALALMGSVFPLLQMRKSSVAKAIRGDRSLDQEENSRGFRLFSALLLSLALPFLYFKIVPVVGEEKPALMGALLLGASFFALLIGLPWLAPRILSRFGSWALKGLNRPFPLASILVRRDIDKKPLRLAVAVIVIAMVAAAFTALKGMTASLRAETEEWAESAIVDKLFIVGMNRVPIAELESAVVELNEVNAIEPGDLRTYAPFLISGVNGEQLESYGPFIDPNLRRRFTQDRTIVVSTRLAQDLDYSVGDSVAIRTGRGVVEDFEVLAISDAYGFQPYPDERIYAVMDQGRMKSEFCINNTRSSRVAIRLTDGVDPDEAKARIRARLIDAFPKARKWKFYTGIKVRDDALQDITQDFFLFDIIILLTAALGAMGILNGQLLSALERNRELGVLKALGASRSQMARLVLLEAGLVGVMGGVLGVALGSLLTPLIVEALEQVSALILPQRSAGLWVFVALGGAFVLPLLASIYPIIRINSMSVTGAIRQG